MIFLDQIKNAELVRTVCFPYKTNTLNKDVLLLIPTKTEVDLYKIVDKLRSNSGNFKVKYLSGMYIPWKKRMKIGSRLVNHINKNKDRDIKNAKDKGLQYVDFTITKIKNYNVVVNNLSLMDEIDKSKVKFTRVNVMSVWNEILETYGLPHEKRYILFTPDNCLLKVNNISTIKAMDIQPNNLYINFLYNLKYNYDTFTKFLADNNLDLIFTDHINTFRFSFKENTLDEEKTIQALFKNFRKMKLGIEIDKSEEDIVLNDEDTEKLVEEKMKSLDEDKINKIVESERNPVPTKVKKDIDSEYNEAMGTALANVDDSSVENAILEDEFDKEVDKKRKEKGLEKAIKVQGIIEKSTVKPKPLDVRSYKMQERQIKVKERNMDAILTNIETLAEGIESRELDITGEYKEFSIADFDTQYQAQAMKDRMEIGSSLSTNDIPLFMTNYNEKIDENNVDNYMKSVQFTFENPDSAKEKHTFTVNVPELREGRYLYINGSDKVMIRQKMALPIIRLSEKVAFTSYYNKIFVEATSGNVTKKSAKIKKFIKFIRKTFSYNDLKDNFVFSPAYHSAKHKNMMSEELLEISKYISKLYIDDRNFFDLNLMGDDNILGRIDGMEFRHNRIDNFYYTDSLDGEFDILFLFNHLLTKLGGPINEYFQNKIVNTKATDNIINTTAYMLGKKIPLLLILLENYKENLLSLLEYLKENYELEYEITPFKEDGKKEPKKFADDDGDQFVFQNFTLDIKYNNIHNRALLDYLNSMELSMYDSLILEGAVEFQINSSNTVLYMANYRTLFIDPITKDVMEQMGLPTTWAEAIIYCNYLFFNYDRTLSEVSLRNERMPSNSEIIQGVLYKKMADSVGEYNVKKKRGSKNAVFSVDKDAVIKELVTLPNVEESSKINPVQNIDKSLTISNKGVMGINDDRSYTNSKRVWDKTFYGVISDVTPYTGVGGISKHLTVNPNISEKRGFFNEAKDIEELENSQLMSVSESLGPFSQRHDSTPRLSMGMMQFQHLLGTEGSDPALVSYGMDNAMASLDVDFAHTLQDDAEIIEVNSRYIKVRYANEMLNGRPREQLFQLDRVERNSSKAFYIPNSMEVNPDIALKKGTKIKKGTTLMYNKNLYAYNGGDIVFKTGPICNVAIANTQLSFEDAVLITETLAKKLHSKTVKRVSVRLNAKNKIINYAKPFTHTKPGEELFKYAEDTGSEAINRDLDLSLLDDTLLKKKVSRYEGEIIDINVYYKLSEEDKKSLDPSIKKYMKMIEDSYETKYDSSKMRQNLIAMEANRDVDHVTEMKGAKRNKINGDSVDKGDILIEYFILVNQPFTIGDKITIGNVALKGVCSKILDEKDTPYGQKTGQKVDLMLSPISPLARMIYSLFINGILTSAMMKVNEELKKIVNK